MSDEKQTTKHVVELKKGYTPVITNDGHRGKGAPPATPPKTGSAVTKPTETKK